MAELATQLVTADTLALLPLVKRQVFCKGDMLKMEKQLVAMLITLWCVTEPQPTR